MDFLKDYIEAWNSRVRSPVFGSILISFFAINWKAFYYLIFAETPAAIRIRFFDLNIHSWDAFVFPIIVGFLLAIGLPWVNLAGSLLVRAPLRRSRDIQIGEVIRSKVVKIRAETDLAEEQARRERAAIDYQKNLIDAEEVGGDALKQKIIEDRKEDEKKKDPIEEQILSSLAMLDGFGRQLVLELGDSPDGTSRKTIETSSRVREAMEREAPNYTPVRFNTKLDTALTTLRNQSWANGGDPFHLSEFGYRLYDRLKALQAEQN